MSYVINIWNSLSNEDESSSKSTLELLLYFKGDKILFMFLDDSQSPVNYIFK